MFKNLGKLKYKTKYEVTEVNFAKLKDGVNNLEKFIYQTI